MTFQGPSEELITTWSRAQQAPGYGFDERAAGLHDRVIAVREFSDLAPADQAFLEECLRAVSAGASATYQDPAEWGGDWAAEDAAVEADDEDGDVQEKAFEPAPDEGDWIGL